MKSYCRQFGILVVFAATLAACSERWQGSSSESGVLIVTSMPEGAAIWLDGYDTRGVTPNTLRVIVGVHHIRLTLRGYEDYLTKVCLIEGETQIVLAELTRRCPGGVVGDLRKTPEIEIIDLKPDDDTIRGTADNVDASTARVVLWAKTDKWYVQPLIDKPYTLICGDGSWENWTHPWNRVVAVLVSSSYVPGSVRLEHPSSDSNVLAWDEYPNPRPDRIVVFSGYVWKAKNADLAGPGPNYFSDSESNVWVDAGGLHLRIEQRDGMWYCAEVFLNHPLGYGEYRFQLDSRVDSLDFQMVFAGFVYESASREIDIEFSRALAKPWNAQYVIQPYYHSGNITRFLMPSVSFSTHRFVWRADKVEFASWKGFEEIPDSLIQSWTYTGSDIPPPAGERMRFNLWLFEGKPPSNGIGTEVVIKHFSHEP